MVMERMIDLHDGILDTRHGNICPLYIDRSEHISEQLVLSKQSRIALP